MIIKITKGQTEGFALVLGNSEAHEKTLKQRNIIGRDVMEKLEQEQIDNKYVLRWTALLRRPDLLRDDGVARTQAGLIYEPDEEAGLLVLFTDAYGNLEDSAGHLVDYIDILTTANIWYKEIPYSKQKYLVVCVTAPLSKELFGLQDIVIPNMLWTDEYELPPLSASVIHQGFDIIKNKVDSLFRGVEK